MNFGIFKEKIEGERFTFLDSIVRLAQKDYHRLWEFAHKNGYAEDDWPSIGLIFEFLFEDWDITDQDPEMMVGTQARDIQEAKISCALLEHAKLLYQELGEPFSEERCKQFPGWLLVQESAENLVSYIQSQQYDEENIKKIIKNIEEMRLFMKKAA